MNKEWQTKASNFLGGMTTAKPVTSFDEPDALVAKNCRFDKDGEVARRKGRSKYNTTRFAGNGSGLGVFDFRYGATGQKVLFAEATKIFTDDGTTRNEIKSGQTAANYYSFATFDSFAWIANGADTFLKYDGTTVTNASIAVPTKGSFSAADSGAVGNVTGVVKYLVTFYVSATGQESNPFALADAVSVTVTNKKVDLTNIPVSADTQVTHRRIYRTTAGGSVYNAQLLTTINDNTTTTYQDNTLDANLGSLIPLDHDAAPVFQKVVVHKNRMFGFIKNSSILYYSKEFNAWYYPQGNDGTDQSATANDFRIYLDPDDGDKITNIVPYYNYLLVFKQFGVYVLEGYDNTDFSVRKIDFQSRVGCVGFRASDIANNWCYFLDRNGVYRTNSQIMEYVGEPMEAFFDVADTSSSLKVNAAELERAIVLTDNRQPNKNIRVSVPLTGSTTNNATLIYNFEKNKWSYDTYYTTQSSDVVNINSIDYVISMDDYGYNYIEENIDGDAGLVSSTATSGNTTTLTDNTQNWTTNIYTGAYVEILDGTSAGDKIRILSNTADTLTIDGTFSESIDATSEYAIGSIDFYYQHRWDDYGNSALTKRLKYIRPRFDATGSYTVDFYIWYDFSEEAAVSTTATITTSSTWDVSLWDNALWDGGNVVDKLLHTASGRIHNWVSIGVGHKTPGEPVVFKGFDKLFQVKGMGAR